MQQLHRLQLSRNVLDSQGFDSYVKGQGLPKWSLIVRQGSGHDVYYCGYYFHYECGSLIVRTAAMTPNFLSKRLLFSH